MCGIGGLLRSGGKSTSVMKGDDSPRQAKAPRLASKGF
jgi:hypothetical protein